MTPNPQYPGAGPAAPKRTSGLATAALVLGILGLCLPPLWVVSIILGIVALSQISREPGLGGKGFAIFGIAAPLVAIPIMGILAAIAIPNFIRFQARARQSECKINLQAIHTAQMAHYAENERYASSAEELRFSPPPNHHYTYYLSAAEGEELSGKLPAPIPVGVQGECPRCSFTAVCAANIDSDEALDVWTISTEPREGPEGEKIPAGKPYNDLNDIRQ